MGSWLLLRVRRAARHADGSRPGAHGRGDRQHLGRASTRPSFPRVRRGALRRSDRPGDRPAAPPGGDRLHAAAGRGDQVRGSRARAVCRWPPSAAHLPGVADRGQRRARLRSRARCRRPGRSSPRAADWLRSHFTRSRTGSSSATSPRALVAVSARPSCRSVSAATSPRQSCSLGVPWRPRRERSPPTRDLDQRICAPPASWRYRRHDARRAHHRRPGHRQAPQVGAEERPPGARGP